MSTDVKSPAGGDTRPLQSQTPETSTGAPELVTAVDELLDQLQHKFDGVSTEIFGKLDDMARRLDELEASLSSAQEESGVAKAWDWTNSGKKWLLWWLEDIKVFWFPHVFESGCYE